jgi:O-antigen ligase
MNSDSSQSRNEALGEASKWLVGGGILTVALAPLALPGLVLAAVLALPVLLLALPIAVIAGAVLLLCGFGRRLVRRLATNDMSAAGRSQVAQRREMPSGSLSDVRVSAH